MQAVEKSPKFYEIKSTAKELFWKHGIRRVTVEEICQEAGVSKMTFYRLFENKIELAKIVLDNIFEKNMQKYLDIMKQDVPFSEKAKQIVLLKFEGTQAISQELLMDIYKYQEPELITFMDEMRKRSINQFLKDMATAQLEGWVRKDIKPEFIIHVLNKIQEMVTDENLLARYGSPQELIMELNNFFFYGILTEKNSR
jgi:AcrR family transcriptional regulator